MADNAPVQPAVSHDRLAVSVVTSQPAAERVALTDHLPGIEDLFTFAREAELRVRRLHMVIEEQVATARGDEVHRYDVWISHPGRARVTTRRDQEAPARDYDVWLLDAGVVTTYLAARKVASRRPMQTHVAGLGNQDMPPYARQRKPLTPLPPGSLADTFVHPHGLFRNVLVTGPLAVVGTEAIHGREAIIVQAEHPRSSKVLVDRPDRSLVVGIDRQTGFLLRLTERIAESVTRHAEVTDLAVDPVLPASVFELRLPADVRMLY